MVDTLATLQYIKYVQNFIKIEQVHQRTHAPFTCILKDEGLENGLGIEYCITLLLTT